MTSNYSLSHLADRHLLRDLVVHVARERSMTALVLAHLAEVEARGVYRAEGYSSMHGYCVGRLHFSEDAASKRIHAAHTARKHPLIFELLGDGRLHMSAVIDLAGYLTDKNARDLLMEAAGKTRSQIQMLLALRFPRPDVPTRIEAVAEQIGLAAGQGPDQASQHSQGLAPDGHAPGRVAAADRPEISPLSPQRYRLRLTMSQAMKEKLEHARNLLSRASHSPDEAEVLERGLDVLIRLLEKRKYGATESPRGRGASDNESPRYLPVHVRRAVRRRDRDRCTFVAANGHHCEERRYLEFDHIVPVARGGKATIDNLRLRCRAHNRLAAEQAFGREFMQGKIEQSRDAAEAKKRAEEVVPWLQALGIRADHARQAAERCASMVDATLEQRVKAALSTFAPRDVALRQASPAL